ncbi:hypothetical protein OJF2_04170 [Aquisphaera giovannonii]|uniref:DUF4149 domain-containing protein n=1 Tax=Aquisphaera giovannonii TaxID=406548 RepID=A0A5B9VW52_9BACT|nr:hypothetical protein [Aquisphaera giovannonii]QEH31950.1 hypothetical protein OJF2_04170 [Aquisphaera giovannonii]
MTVVRRWFLLWALMFWQGGFMFYGGVVVPVGAAVLGSDQEQGFITRSVTNYLNLAGAVALALWGWELAAGRGETPGGRRFRWAIWAALVLLLGLLAWLHIRLDALLDPDAAIILDRPGFRAGHRRYLMAITAQWAGCLLLTALTILAWRDEDATRPFAGRSAGG